MEKLEKPIVLGKVDELEITDGHFNLKNKRLLINCVCRYQGQKVKVENLVKTGDDFDKFVLAAFGDPDDAKSVYATIKNMLYTEIKDKLSDDTE